MQTKSSITHDLISPKILARIYVEIRRRKPLVSLKKTINGEIVEMQQYMEQIDRVLGYRKGKKIEEAEKLLSHEFSQIRLLHESIDEPFSIFVMGMGNHGKSTLINALIGVKKAEVDFRPKTWKIDIFQHLKDQNTVLIRYDNGVEKKVSLGEAKKILHEEENKRTESDKKVCEEFKKYQEKDKYNVQALQELKRKIQNQYLYMSPIIEVVWPCKKSMILDNFRLVDTPGLKQELLSEDIRSSLTDYYSKADGVLWIIDATVLSKKVITDTLDEIGIGSQGKKIKKNIIGILNKMDKIVGNDPEAIQRTIDKANEIYGNFLGYLVPLSAKQALEGVLSGDSGLISRSGYDDLIFSIKEKFLDRAVDIKFSSKLIGFKKYCGNVCSVLDEILKDMSDKKATYDKLKDGFEKEMEYNVSYFVDQVSADLKKYENSVAENINYKTHSLLNRYADSSEAYIKSRVRKDIFEEEKIKEILEKNFNTLIERMEKIRDYWAPKSVISEFKYLKEDSETKRKKSVILSGDIQDGLPEISVNIEAVILAIIATGVAVWFLGPIALIIGIFGGKSIFKFIKESVINAKLPGIKEDLKNGLRRAVSSTKDMAKKEADKIASDVRKSIDDIRDGSFAEIYCEQKKYDELVQILFKMKSMERVDVVEANVNDILEEEYNAISR